LSIYFCISILHYYLYWRKKTHTHTTTKKKKKKRNIINILSIFCYILSTLQIFLGMAVIKNVVLCRPVFVLFFLFFFSLWHCIVCHWDCGFSLLFSYLQTFLIFMIWKVSLNFQFNSFLYLRVFTESYLQNRIIDKRLSLPPIWAYISISVFYTIICFWLQGNKLRHSYSPNSNYVYFRQSIQRRVYCMECKHSMLSV
jgi:hypothetical protein